MNIVKVENVSKQYQQGSVIVDALKNVDLNIETAEFIALVGPSGSGKTTLLNMIGALDVPSEGKIQVDGKEIGSLSKRERSNMRLHKVGFIFQEYNLIPVLTAVENVEYVMLLQGVDEKQRRQKAMAILDEVGLQGSEHRRPSQLSGGQQQRVAVARAIVSAPAIILADEPTANLDSQTGAALLDLMRELNTKRKVTFIFSTHDSMVMERAKRLVTLKDGQIINDSEKQV